MYMHAWQLPVEIGVLVLLRVSKFILLLLTLPILQIHYSFFPNCTHCARCTTVEVKLFQQIFAEVQ